MTFNFRTLMFEIQHIFPKSVIRDFKTQMDNLGISQQQYGNLLAMPTDQSLIENLAGKLSESAKSIIGAAGWGWNRHDSQAPAGEGRQHNGYTNFIRDQLTIIFDTDSEGNPLFSADEQRLLVYDLHKFAADLSYGRITDANGVPVRVLGNSGHADTIAEAYAENRSLDPNNIDAWTPIQIAEVRFYDTYMNGPEGNATVSESTMRKKAVDRLADALADAGDITTQARDSIKAQAATGAEGVDDAGRRLLKYVDLKTGQPIGTRESMLEWLAAETRGTPETANLSFDDAVAKWEGVINESGRISQSALPDLRRLDADTQGAVTDGFNKMAGTLNGVGGGPVADIVEFFDIAYEDIKTFFATGDPSRLISTTIEFGFGMASSAALVSSTIAIGATLGGPPGAAIVAAAWAIYDFPSLIESAASLITKIGEDIAELVTPDFGLVSTDKTNQLIWSLIDFLADEEVTSLTSPFGFQYSADTDEDRDVQALPDYILGSDANEAIVGRNGAFIYGQGGNDELHHLGNGYASGGDGDDLLLSRSHTGVSFNGGKGNDWLIVRSGEGGEFVGGEGQDVIFVASRGAGIWGDTRDGVTYDDEDNPSDIDTTSIEEADLIWWWPGVTMLDPGPTDKLRFFGVPLVGGTNDFPLGFATTVINAVVPVTGFATFKSPLYFDYFLPFISYMKFSDGTLYVSNLFDTLFGADKFEEAPRFQTDQPNAPNIEGAMAFINYEDKATYWSAGFRKGAEEDFANATSIFDLVFAGDGFNPDIGGDLGMFFKNANPILDIFGWLPVPAIGGLLRLLPMIDKILTLAGAVQLWTKAFEWREKSDPLILDLDGDGIETISRASSKLFYDFDGDLFAEQSGWLQGDDGFLVRDANGNGRIDDVTEMFGGVGVSGYEELSGFDTDGNNAIDAADEIFAELQVWRDINQDRQTDEGELFSLDDLGIISISLETTELGFETPDGTRLDASGKFTWADGSQGNAFDAVFEIDDVNTIYNGETGNASWLNDEVYQSRGFGHVVDFDIAMSNDIVLGEMATVAAASMTTPKLKTLLEQSAGVLGQWAFTQPLSRELTPVLLETLGDGTVNLLDRAIYVEDGTGGYWTLASGADVTDSGGVVIDRPTMEDIMALSPAAGAWQVEQMFSPSDRGEELVHRTPAPYLAERVDDRMVILDWGVEQPDGSWQLASGTPIVDADGATIAQPTIADVLAQAKPLGQEWRTETLSFNEYANLPVEEIGINFIDNKVVDYTVEVADQDGTFYVWARNLDRALELQAKYGTAQDFNLRNYEIDFDTLDEVGSTDDSTFRVELLTPGQFHLAISMFGIDFQPQMLQAQIAADTGVLSYTVSPERDTGVLNEDGEYVSGINGMINLLDPVMDQYIQTSRAFAARMALQGGLNEYSRGLEYIADFDGYRATTDRELTPLFEAIFESIPAGYDEARQYLVDWNEILVQIWPDYKPAAVNQNGTAMSVDQNFLIQMMLPAYETIPTDLDLRSVLFAMSIDQTRLVEHMETDTEVTGTSGVDYLYMTAGDQIYKGGQGTDVYFVGGEIGSDIIDDVDTGQRDGLRFADVKSDEVDLERDGQDLVITFNNRDDVLRVKDQFLGELNPILTNGKRLDSGMDHLAFADGILWNRFQIAMQVSEEKDTNDVIIGSGSGDVLRGGKGNDVMRGGTGGDYYFFNVGDGQDVVGEALDFGASVSQAGFGSLKGGLDMIFFGEGIGERNIRLQRDGQSDDLLIVLLDDDGVETGDTLYVEDQFGGVRLNFGALGEIDPQLDVDYISPYLIERFIFSDGYALDFEQIVEQVLENAKTDGDDAIYGLLNDNRLDGGAGDDFLTGLEGSDTYVFGRGYGEDVVLDDDYSLKLFGAPDDYLEFVDDLRWSDFDFLRDGASDTLRMQIKGTGDTLILTDYLESVLFVGYVNLIEQITYGDGTVWSWTKLLQHYVDIAKTADDDLIYGFDVSDFIDGGAGDDRLEGQGGNDTYVFERGYGTDTILDYGGAERVEMRGIRSDEVTFSRTDLDLIITVDDTGDQLILENQYVRANVQNYAVEDFVFEDRIFVFTDLNPEDLDLVGTSLDETITGSNFNETLDGRDGDDLLIGRDGGDTYKFDAGYGQDVIVDIRERAAWEDRRFVPQESRDTVEFGGDITRDNVIFTKDGDDLVVSIEDRVDTLRIRDQFKSLNIGVELFKFFDGSIIAISDVEELLQIEGGNRGDNVIEGLPDTENELDGRQGDDILRGANLGDKYAFGAGYDLDIIEEYGDVAGIIDEVIFGETVRAEDLIIRRNGNDLLIDLGNGEDVLTIVDGLTDATIEEFNFADGTILTTDDMRDRLLVGTDGDDLLQGFDDRADDLAGGAGSDALEGGTGNDTYRYGYGDGADSIRDTGGTDEVRFGVGIEEKDLAFRKVGDDFLITLTQTGETLVILQGASASSSNWIETFVFSDGSELSMTDARTRALLAADNGGMDLIDARDLATGIQVTPGVGFDAVIMGPDTILQFRQGDGIDRIELPTSSGQAEIIFDELTTADVEVRVTRIDGNDLTLSFPETGDQLILVGARDAAIVPTLSFADGQVWDRAALLRALIEGQQTDGDDVIFGTGQADSIEGGRGNDDIFGEGADDTFTFTLGDGQDVIADSSGNDTLIIRGYDSADLRISLPVNGSSAYGSGGRVELVLSFDGTSDEIVLRYDGDANGVDSVVFDDGTVITRDEMFSQALGQGTEFDDVMTGTDANEVFEGGKGDDEIRGGAGNDTYTFREGDGRDVIIESGSRFDLNTLILPDHLQSDVKISRIETSSDALLQLPNGEEIVLEGALYEFSGRVNVIRFADGSTWNSTQILARADSGGAITVPRTITGTAAGETLEGTPEAEILEGLTGSDTYIFARGGGHDRIVSQPNRPDVNILEMQGYDLADASFSVSPLDAGNLVITFAGTDDRILVEDAFYSSSTTSTFSDGIWTTTYWRSIQTFRFDDDQLSIDAIGELLTSGSATDGDDLLTATGLRDEVIEGGLGNDTIMGPMGNATIVFNKGDGQDVVKVSTSGRATLEIKGYLPAEVSVARDTYAERGYILTFEGTDDQIILEGNGRTGLGGVDRVEFDDGTVWTSTTLDNQVPPPPEGAGGTPGNDIIRDQDGNETFNPMTGDDVVISRDDTDTVIYARGDGVDTIEADTFPGVVLDLTDLNPADVVLQELPMSDGSVYGGRRIELQVIGSDDRVHFVNGFDSLLRIEFADGTVWNYSELQTNLVAAPLAEGQVDFVSVNYSSDPNRIGTTNDEFFSLQGFEGESPDAEVVYSRGGGHDLIEAPDFYGFGGANRVLLTDIASTEVTTWALPFAYAQSFGGGRDLLIRWGSDDDSVRLVGVIDSFEPTGLAEVEFSDGVIWLVEDMVTDALAAEETNQQNLTGDPTLTRGTDTGDFAVGGQGGGIIFPPPLELQALDEPVPLDPGDLPPPGEPLPSDPNDEFTEITLVDVLLSEITVEERAGEVILTVAPRLPDGSDGLSIWMGNSQRIFDISVTLDDGTVLGREEILALIPVPVATADDDRLIVGDQGGPITVEGLQGDDLITSTTEDTTFIYTRGDGNDTYTVEAFGTPEASLDLRGIAPDDVNLVNASGDLLVRIAESAPGAGDGGVIRILVGLEIQTNVFGPRIAEILFDDGTIWDLAELESRTIINPATEFDDEVINPTSANTYEMLGGNDYVQTSGFNDTYIYRSGDGRDAYLDSGSNADVLELPDFLQSDVTFTRVNSDLVIDVIEDVDRGIEAGQINVKLAFNSTTSNNWLLERIVFSDASELLMADVVAGLVDTATDGDDIVTGTPLDETLTGGLGDDSLRGLNGDDTYVYARGDGNDEILEQGNSGTALDVDRLQLTDINAGSVSFVRTSEGLLIKIAESAPGAGDAGSILVFGLLVGEVNNYEAQDRGTGIEEVVFGDGSVLTMGELSTQLLAAQTSPLDDVLTGSGLSETLEGGLGNDLMFGGDGPDTYIYTRGDGYDRVVDIYNSTTGDVLELRGIDPADVTLKGGYQNDLEIVIAESAPGAGDEGRITARASNSFGSAGIDSIVFDDGTVWPRSMFSGSFATGIATDGDDRVTGTTSADVIEGLLGNDRLEGGSGADTYLFTRGDGQDVIDDRFSQSNRLEVTGYGPDEISFDRRGIEGRDLIIRLADAGDEILVVDGLNDDFTPPIEEILLTDGGETITYVEIVAALVASQVTDGDDVVVGTVADDALGGGKGVDLVDGRAGDDTYTYRAGDGDDRFSDSGISDEDVVNLPDHTPDDIEYALRAGANSLDLVILFKDSRDRLILEGALGQGYPYDGVDKIVFSDGTEWDRAEMRAQTLNYVQTSFADQVQGFEQDDVFIGSAGNDVQAGLGGSDLYIFSRGDGEDTIEEGTSNTGEIDRVDFPDFVSSEVSVSRLFKGSDTVVMRFASSPEDSLTITDALAPDGAGIEQYVFSDGVVWVPATLETLLDNNAPVAIADGYFTATSGEPLLLAAATLLRNDFDADGDDLSLIAVDGGENGFAEINADGNVVFTPDAEFFGPTTITYTISDGRNGITTGTIDLRVRPVAEARDDDGFVMEEDTFLTIDAERLLSNDLDGDRMIISQVFGAENGSVSLASNGQVTFTPDANYNGVGRFTYVANTPEGGRAEAVVTINVTPVNDAPDARDDNDFETLEDVPVEILASILLANDRDADGDALSVTDVTSSADIDVSLTDDGVIIVTPRDYFFGNGTFTYTVTDEDGLTDTATVTVYVEPVNNAPEPTLDVIDAIEDNPKVINVDTLLANDIDRDGDTLTITSLRPFEIGGRAELLDNDTILFTPFANFNGTARFEYIVDDGQGSIAVGMVNVEFEAVNDRPIARDDRYTFSSLENVLNGVEDVPLVIPIAELMKNDNDVEGLALTFENVSDPADGTIEVTDEGTIIFTPDQDFWGETTFSYLVSDPEGLVDDGMVTMFFENVGDAPPVAGTDSITVIEDVPITIPQEVLLANDIDIDRDPLEIIGWRLPNFTEQFFDPFTGSLTRDANGDFLYTPGLNETRENGFYYLVTDNADGVSEGYVDITILAQNDQPTAVNDTVASSPLDIPVVIRISDIMENDFDVDDPDGEKNISFVGVDGASIGTAEVDGNFIVLRVPEGTTGIVEVTYRIKDPEGVEDTATVTALIEGTYGRVLNGTPRADLLIGNDLDETINGLESNDRIVANGGADIINGGTGEDDIDAGEGDDFIDGGDDADDIDGGEGFDTVTYELSNVAVRADLASRLGQGGWAAGDVLTDIEGLIGTEFGDDLYGGLADNRIEGRGGNDLIDGREGVDTLLGEMGDDTLIGGAEGDTLDGGEGSDTADYSTSVEGVTVSLIGGTASGGDATGDTLISIENLTGTDQADDLTGTDEANILRGGREGDILRGLGGDDFLSGGRGADDLQGGEGIDTADYTLSVEGVTVDMADGSAGGGDAEGDTFDSIEIVQGSFHDDILRGNADDNILRGGRGADEIDGRGGFNTADYSVADEGIALNLETGLGTGGEALGDTLSNIQKVTGSVYADDLTGSAAGDTFDGNWGDDTMAGQAGSDAYIFGYDSGDDVVTEAGVAGDIDRVVLMDDIRTRDLSVIREGDDLLLELERDDGFLIDTLRVTNHFLSEEEGIEEVVFADGTIWDRAQIDALQRIGRFNAADDIYRLAIEDIEAFIDPADLIENDISNPDGLSGIELVGVENAINGQVSITPEGQIRFIGDENFNGDAFFDYVVRDQFGRESSARVEVNVAPVNDAPEGANDGIFAGVEDTILRINITELLSNDFDVDGDPLSLIEIRPLLDDQGEELNPQLPGFNDFPFSESATFGIAMISGNEVLFKPKADHFGFAGFIYVLSDPDGATSTAEVELFFDARNDAPRSGNDERTIRLERTTDISVASLLANDYDVEDDAFTFEGVGAATNGTLVYDEVAGIISFTPDALGAAGFTYDLVDARGAASTITVDLTVIPLNDAPIARDDGGFVTEEDVALEIDPSVLFANDTDDTDPIDDVIMLSGLDRFAENGVVSLNDDGLIVFTPRADYNGSAGFLYQITDGNGGFDEAYVSITILPSNDGPVLRDDIALGLEDLPIVVIPGEVFGNDLDPEGDVIFFENVTILGAVTSDFETRNPVTLDFGFDPAELAETIVADAVLADGSVLPVEIVFDPETLSFSGSWPAGQVDPLEIDITLTNPNDGSSFAGNLTLTDQSDLAGGVAFEPEMALIDISEGDFTLEMAGNQPVPGWLAFDPETLELTKTGDAPVEDTDPIRLRLSFEPDPELLPDGTRSFGERGFMIEVLIDPQADIDPAINDLFANDPFFASQGLYALPLEGTTREAQTENGADLPDWLNFDAATMTFDGTPPPVFVGTPPVRVDVTGGPVEFSLLTELEIDKTFRTGGDGGFGISLEDDRFGLSTPEDFFGQVALEYNARDEKGGTSDLPAYIIVNVLPQPEAPDPVADEVSTTENVTALYALADLLANDVDDDGDAFRAIEITQPANGTITVLLSELILTTPAELPVLAGGTYSATLVDGSALPDWLTVDPDTGEIRGFVPLDATGPLAITLSVTDGTTTETADLTPVLDGNEGVMLEYVPNTDFSGEDSFGYTITDDLHGTGSTTVTVTVAAVNDPPVAVTDNVDVLEDSSVIIDPATLLANDTDVDGDPLTLLSVGNAINGTVVLENGQITFTPVANYDGPASFTYEVSDGSDGTSTGTVRVNVISTNNRPVAARDDLNGTEDEPLTITIADLLANDSDADGDPFTFVSIDTDVDGARSFLLPGGEIQFVTDEDVNGPITFTYRITDGRLTGTGEVVIDFAAVNDGPRLIDDGTLTAVEDTPLQVDMAFLLANDVDVEGDAFSVTRVFDPENGTVTLENGIATFTPRTDYAGNAGFRYEVTDARGAVSENFIDITVLPGNDLPFAVFDRLETNEDTPLEIDPAVLLANDSDPDGDPLTVTSVFSSFFIFGQGIVTVPLTQLANGNFLFTPRADDFSEATLFYSVTDGGPIEVQGTILIDLLPTPDDPEPRDDAVSGLEDVPLTLLASQLLANDSDPDKEALTIIGTSNFSGVDVVVNTNGTLTVTPSENLNGGASFDYTVRDTSGAEATATVNLTFEAVNDVPVIGDVSFAGTEDTAFAASLDPALFTDADGDALTIGIRGAGNTELPDWLDFTLATLTLAGTPPQDFNGDVALELFAFDGMAETVRPVTLTIAAVNDAPVITLDGLDGIEDVPLDILLEASVFADVDGDALTLGLQGPGGEDAPDWIVFDGDALTITGTPPQDFNGDVALELTASDGTVTTVLPVTLSLAAINDAPEARNDLLGGGDETVFTIPASQLLANDVDVDGDVLSVVSVADGPGYTAELADDGTITVTKLDDMLTRIEMGYTITDGALESSATLVIDLENSNTAPEIGAIDPLHSDEDTEIDLVLPEVFTDADGDALALSITRAGGTAAPDWLSFDPATKRLTGTPPANFFGTIALLVIADDGQATTSRAFDLVIDPINDLPSLSVPLSDRMAVEDTAFSIQLQQGIYSDVDGDVLSFDLVQADGTALPDWIAFDADTLTLSGTPPQDLFGDIALRLLISDGQETISDDFVLAVEGTEDAPVLLAALPDVTADDAGETLTTGVPFSVAAPRSSFTDPDGDALAFSARLADGTALPGWLIFDGQQFAGVAPASAAGDLEIEFFATDGKATVSDVFVLSFEQGQVGNTGPVAVDDTVAIDLPVLLKIDSSALLENDSDADGDTLEITAVGAAGNGEVTLGADGVVNYLANFGFEGTDQFTYTVSDGTDTDTATVTVEVSNPYDNVVEGNDANSRLNGTNGSDMIFGFGGNDRISGGGGDDFIDGGDGNDVIIDGDGDDIIQGGRGNDRMYSGRGSDTFRFETGDGSDTIYRFSANQGADATFRPGDVLSLSVEGIDDIDDLMAIAEQTSRGVLFDFGNGDKIFLAGTQLAALDNDQFSFY